MSLAPTLHKLRNKEDLSAIETEQIFNRIFEGAVPEEHIAAFLLALRRKGETVDEIIGAVQSMRGKALTIAAPDNAIDIVGTGGDGQNTLNISTAAALVVAACGIPVAKHGNRAASSKSGSSDMLAALGVNLEADFGAIEEALATANICFLFAPRHHPAMRHVADVRRKLGVRTIFNLLGPLTNPAHVKQHVIGVYDNIWLIPMAEVLQSLGSRSAWITHGRDGMDEITSMDISDIVALKNDQLLSFTVKPGEAGVQPPSLQEIQGSDALSNAKALQNILAGEKNAYSDIVALNAAAALVVAGKVSDLPQGMDLANQSLASGAAGYVLEKLIEITNRVKI